MSSTSISATITPPSDNNKRMHEPPNTTAQLTKKQKKALAKVEQKEANFNKISAANKTILSYDATKLVLITPPEIKPFIKDNDHTFTIGSYVEVLEDYTTGLNRPSGCGYVKQITNDVMDVKFTPAHDGGRLHKNIPISKVITAILNQDMMIPTVKRIKETEVQIDEVETKIDTRTITDLNVLHRNSPITTTKLTGEMIGIIKKHANENIMDDELEEYWRRMYDEGGEADEGGYDGGVDNTGQLVDCCVAEDDGRLVGEVDELVGEGDVQLVVKVVKVGGVDVGGGCWRW